MTTSAVPATEAFGVEPRERVLRRLVAAALATWIAAPLSLFAIPIAYGLALPLSFVLEHRWPGQPGRPSLIRYGLLGAVLGAALVLALPLELPPPWVALGMAVGSLSGGTGAWVATVLPGRWVPLVALLGTALTLGVIGTMAVAGLPALSA